MKSDAVVRQQLLFLLSGGNAHNTFEQAVVDFPMEFVNAKPKNISYSPWHLLEHIRIAQSDILEFIRDPEYVSPKWPEGYWPAPDQIADTKKWEKTISEFKKDLRDIQELVKDKNTDLYSPIPHAPDYTIFREILLVADHNAYHIGEFGIVKQILGA